MDDYIWGNSATAPQISTPKIIPDWGITDIPESQEEMFDLYIEICDEASIFDNTRKDYIEIIRREINKCKELKSKMSDERMDQITKMMQLIYIYE